ncbi:proline-serine-threonine phosphatase-interacting protein 2-like isoform X1 [Mytilus edulis]|uniref:proline-serine-threonine phosphatase-interacting protein 2-like isoform X1 n=1 Tax=Mytilus edulis TaxID=6550 RepID=UPI0039EF04E4
MTRLKFVDGFWEADFLGVRGYEILCQRLKSGKKMCKELDEFLKERIKAEQAYSKALSIAVKKIGNPEEMGDLGRSILQLQRETEKMSAVHDLAAKQFLSLERELTEFSGDQNSKRHATDEIIRKSNQLKQQSYKQTISLKEKYTQRCREKDNAEEAFNNAKQSVTVKTKDLDKIEKVKDKAIETMEQADQSYKNSIETLENTRTQWEKDMENTCSEFEHLEEARIELLRDLIWKCTNIDSQTCVDHDQCAENVRQMLELCDIDKELHDFIEKNKTGSERPELPTEVFYENYYAKKGSSGHDQTRQNDKTTLSRRPPERIPQDLPKQPRVRPPPARPIEQPKATERITTKEQCLISFDDDITSSGYSSISDVRPKRGPNITESGYSDVHDVIPERAQGRIQRPYTSKSPSEHNVQVGEVVEIVREMPGNSVQIMKNGRIGIIPKQCIQMKAYV